MERSWTIAVWILVLVMAAAVAAGIATTEGWGQSRTRPGTPTGAGALAAAISTELELNEILAGPARDWDGNGVFDAREDEWLEIVNRTGAPVDLTPYRVSDADSTIRFAFTGTLAPDSILLVTGRMAEDWQRSVGRTATGLSLNNSGDTVILFRLSGPDTVAVDRKTYNSIEGASDRSTGRFGTDGSTWALFDGLNKYTGSGEPQGTGCAPTPGGTNACPTPVVGTTWGKIKMQYR
jgi:hypothetical protein